MTSKELLELRLVQEYSIKETARILDKSESSVRSSLHRAQNALN
ncbi:sigma factor-like helix-turn-helix DNA-binding protein [Paenibacillus sp. FSL H8-0168]